MENDKHLFDQEFWQNILPSIYHYALMHVHFRRLPEELADDLVQETVTLVLTGKRNWDPSKTDILTFLKGVIKSILSHYLESAYQKKQIKEHQSKEDNSANFLDTFVNNEFTSQQYLERNDIEKILLDEADGDEDMQFVLLCLFDEKKRSEIAKELVFPLAKVDSIMKRIKRITKKVYERFNN
jgi:RNA polymerase sigma factor (sigma-70 family)